MAPRATLIFKIFLSPLDPSAALLRSQLRAFFPGPPPGDQQSSHPDVCEIDDTRTDFEHGEEDDGRATSATQSSWGPGYDSFGRPGGVWVRKPRSSRKGSGGELCKGGRMDCPNGSAHRGATNLANLGRGL